MVRDKFCFSRTRWMSYGWYFFGRRNVKPNAKKLMKNIKILKILWRWSWRNVKIKMDIKAEVLSKKVQDWWTFSKTDGEVCHGKLRIQHTFRRYDEDVFKTKISIQRIQDDVLERVLLEIQYDLNGVYRTLVLGFNLQVESLVTHPSHALNDISKFLTSLKL